MEKLNLVTSGLKGDWMYFYAQLHISSQDLSCGGKCNIYIFKLPVYHGNNCLKCFAIESDHKSFYCFHARYCFRCTGFFVWC